MRKQSFTQADHWISLPQEIIKTNNVIISFFSVTQNM